MTATASFSLARVLGTCATVALLAATAPGCASSRPRESMSAGISDAGGDDLERGLTPGVEQTMLPAGGRFLGVAFLQGGGVEVVRTPDGTYYTGAPDSPEFVPVYDRELIRAFDRRFAALEKTAGTGHPEIMPQRPGVTGATWNESAGDVETVAGNLGAALNEQPPAFTFREVRYKVSLPDRLARIDFVLPADAVRWFVSPVRMPYALTDWGVVKRDDGSLEVFYEASGTDTFITDVLGAMMHQGFHDLARNDPLLGEIRVTIDPPSKTATVTWNGEPAPDPYHTLSLQPTVGLSAQ